MWFYGKLCGILRELVEICVVFSGDCGSCMVFYGNLWVVCGSLWDFFLVIRWYFVEICGCYVAFCGIFW